MIVGKVVGSVVSTRKNERLIGQTAKRQAVTNYKKTISSIKREMGTDHTVSIDDKKYNCIYMLITKGKAMTNKERFIEIFRSKIKREGAEKLLDYICSSGSDFFTAPASTRFHGAYEGGLLEHSLNVYECLCDFVKRPRFREKYGFTFSEESLAIAALLHDLCKTNFYKTEMRNVKKNGVWESVPYYTIEDNLPYGHGEKSVYIISGFMKLTREEAFAIRYHMGFAEDENKRNVGKSFELYPLGFALHMADMEATYFLEGKD
mgnify:CR=1 FL=1